MVGMRLSLVAALFWVVVLAASRSDARGPCPAGFSPLPRVGCVQDDCVEAGGIYDAQMRCTCGESKACTAAVTYTRRDRARCKDTCPDERIVACVPRGRPCPGEQPAPCQQDSECPACSYCDGKQCARATALVATARSTDRERGEPAGVDWRNSRVTFWPEKAWAIRYLLMQGCRLAFSDVESSEQLVEQLADRRVKALAYFGPCAEDALRRAEGGQKDIFGKERPAAQARYQPTLGGMTAAELRDGTRAALEKKLAAGFRRLGRAPARKKATEAAQALTQSGWLHLLLNSTCHGLDDASMGDVLVRPGGVYWGRKGTARPGLPLTRHERAE